VVPQPAEDAVNEHNLKISGLPPAGGLTGEDPELIHEGLPAIVAGTISRGREPNSSLAHRRSATSHCAKFAADAGPYERR
jgi:hypothetical protein